MLKIVQNIAIIETKLVKRSHRLEVKRLVVVFLKRFFFAIKQGYYFL